MKKKVLIMAAGTAASWYLISTMKKYYYDKFDIYSCDINPHYLVPASLLSDKFFQVPRIDSEGYYNIMLDLFKMHSIEIIVPLIDWDVKLFCRDNRDLKKIGVISTAPPERTVEICYDKKRISNFLHLNGIHVPQQMSLSSIVEDREYFIKPVNGFGSMGAQRLIGRRIKELDESLWMIEEICNHPEVTIDVFNYQGVVSCVARERIEVKSGVCTKARIFHDDELLALVRHINTIIKLPEATCIQVMRNKSNRPAVIDLNLRIGAGTALSAAAGWDIARASLGVWGGIDQDPFTFVSPLKGEKFVTRVFTEVLMNEQSSSF